MSEFNPRRDAFHRIDEVPAALEGRLIPDGQSKCPWYVDRLICSDALSALRHLPDSCVDCIVTSPPYFGQRDYEIADQIGAEDAPDQYIAALTSVFAECFRVLTKTGSLWVNIGDKYEQLELLGLPWQLALSLRASGWILRSDIIWSKPNAMPSSIKNRFTTSHEYLFFFVKGKEYYFDADAVGSSFSSERTKSADGLASASVQVSRYSFRCFSRWPRQALHSRR